MQLVCPVCNGFRSLSSRCPRCGKLLQDDGRLADFFGDYSPYRPIDDSKRTNGYPDLSLGQCLHVTWCEGCQEEQLIGVDEREQGMS